MIDHQTYDYAKQVFKQQTSELFAPLEEILVEKFEWMSTELGLLRERLDKNINLVLEQPWFMEGLYDEKHNLNLFNH